jgi:hypothetical protein
MDSLSSIAAVLGISLLAIALLVGRWLARRTPAVAPLPTQWALSARPVFSTDERRVYKLMREALPHHVILSKLPLVRFCQPSDPGEVRFWYDLLGSINVTFAVCSANGRVLAAIDLDIDRGNSRRILQIKQSVLGACRVRYLRCPVDNLPSAGELQLLVPSATAASRGVQSPAAASGLDEARDSLASTVASRRAQRTALWQDSSLFQDSFFAPDSRLDSFGSSDFSGLHSGGFSESGGPRSGFSPSGNGALNGGGRSPQPAGSPEAEDGGGAVVVDASASSSSRSHH